ncbi:DUF3413 domain-containing protein [Gilliamella sp. WF3-4]|uniref:DUF3413 domain-containing protein n=1 Tax=Gilliamella sp. WF3-4 TaxID=3120255 RepID=UPI00080E83C3|nr:DUF3413 domain-containing protein [Gilliamella apicola]OCG19576.1 hypothetical protein A9G47_00235 [Gilliamella apicola]
MLRIKNTYFKDERSSQIVSWGHWFTLFNIFIVIILGSQYLIIADWPRTFMGRFYAIISAIGHFSYLTFIAYLVLLFPLSFFIHSSRWQRIIATVFATVGISLLLIDIEVFSHFRMHLNLSIWQLFSSQKVTYLSSIFIIIPFILLIEILFSVWSWKKLRSLSKRKCYAKPVVVAFIICFVTSHLTHIWADANFYRPITMQRSSLPLSYPLTARHFLERYGFMKENGYRDRVTQEGNPFAIAIEYPLGRIVYDEQPIKNNVLIITIDGWNVDLLSKYMPKLNEFAQDNIAFTNHYVASNHPYLNNFSLFYGLDPNYYNSILVGHKPSVLFEAATKRQYNLGLFSVDGFAEPLYRSALLSNFSISEPKKQTNKQITESWMAWHKEQNNIDNHAPSFSIIQYSLGDKNKKIAISALQLEAKKLDQNIASLMTYLKLSNASDDTVVIVTGSNDIKIDEAKKIALRNTGSGFNRDLLKVPLIISWPGKEKSQVTQATSQTDIMCTLMQDVFYVTTPPRQYSQGKSLFSPKTRQWLVVGDENTIAAIYDDKTVVLDASGRSKIYDLNGKLKKGEKISLPIFLQIVTENRRFMVVDN